jgi:hypothetical protein
MKNRQSMHTRDDVSAALDSFQAERERELRKDHRASARAAKAEQARQRGVADDEIAPALVLVLVAIGSLAVAAVIAGIRWRLRA